MLRKDLQYIISFVENNSRVLDVGCGEGVLIELLQEQKNIDARGIEIKQSDVRLSVKKGLPVVQGDADCDLIHYPDKSFDYVISSKTLQATKNPKKVLQELLRIGKKVIVSVPNFGHWYNRLYLGFYGRMPVSNKLSYQWYETPNIHFSTKIDFEQLCDDINAKIIDRRYVRTICILPNLFSESAVFVLQEASES